MKIHPIIANNPLENIFYILEYGDKQALVIDPSDSQLTQDYLNKHNLNLQRILITHEHYDHYEGVEGLNCNEVYAGSIASKNMPISVTHIFEDGEIVFEYEGISIKAIFTPGHASGHMMFEMSEEKNVGDAGMRPDVMAIFSGDVLFSGGVGHTKNGNSEDLYNSVSKFRRYSDDVMIYSGHDYFENNAGFIKKYFPEKIEAVNEILQKKGSEIYFTNLGQERSYNPFIGVKKDEFIKIRELRNNY